MFLRAQCPVTLKETPDGWSSQEVFLEWVETVLVKETQPLSNPQKCILLLVDGSKTHLTLQGLQKMKSWGVEVVVFPPDLTDVIQPLDKAVFRALKALFRKKEEHWKRRTHHCAGRARVSKSHCHVFLGGLDPGQAPLKTLLLMLRLT